MNETVIIAPIVDAFKEQVNKLPEKDRDPVVSGILRGPKRGSQWIPIPVSNQDKVDSEIYDDVEDHIEESFDGGEDSVFLSFCAALGVPFQFGPSPMPYQPNEQAIRRIIEEEVYENVIKKIMFEEINENGTFLDFVSSIKEKDTNVFNYFSNLGLEKVEDLMHRARQEKLVMQSLYRI